MTDRPRKGLTEEQIRRKFADLLPELMFEMASQRGAEPTKRTAKARTVRNAKCPLCRQDIGVIKVPVGFQTMEIFRVHDKRTIKGHRFRCDGSEKEAPR